MRGLLDLLVKYWVILCAIAGLIFYLGGFVITLNQLQTEQTQLRLRILEVEQRQIALEKTINVQNIEVVTRLTRMEVILEEIRRQK